MTVVFKSESIKKMKGPYPLKLHFPQSLAMFVHQKTDIHISEQIIENGEVISLKEWNEDGSVKE